MTSMIAHADAMDGTDGTSVDTAWTHTDGMADDLDDWNTTPKAKTPLNLTLPNVILPNYLRMAQILTVHNTSV